MVVKGLSNASGAGMILGHPIDVMIESMQPCSSDDPHLAHAATEHLPPPV